LYRVVLTVDGRELAQTVRIEADPTLPPSAVAVESTEEITERDLRKWRPEIEN
jgi:hypothetical protein